MPIPRGPAVRPQSESAARPHGPLLAWLAVVLLAAPPTWAQQGCWWDQDFDGDETIGLADLFLFADHMGTREGQPGWDPSYDVVTDGRIDVDDFFRLADWWPRGWAYRPGECGDELIAPAAALQLALDGDGDYVVIPRNSLLAGNEAQTVTARFRLDRFTSGNTFGWSQILANDEFELAVRPSDHELVACCYNAPSTIGGGVIETGRWYSVAFVRDGDRQRLYLDSAEVASGTVSIVEPALDLWIGNDPSPPTRPFAGAIDDVAIWRRALSVDEIVALAAGGAVSADDLKARWDFDGPRGGPVRDRSGHGLHGRLVGDAHLLPEGSGPEPSTGDGAPAEPATPPEPATPAAPGAPLLTTTTAGDLVFRLLSTDGAFAHVELGLGTPETTTAVSERDVIFQVDIVGNTFTAQPAATVSKGFYPAGSGLHFYSVTDFGGRDYWAFSEHLGPDATAEDRVMFEDTDGSHGGSIIDTLGVDHFVLNLDDAASVCCDDDDNELVVDVRVVPAGTSLDSTAVDSTAPIPADTTGAAATGASPRRRPARRARPAGYRTSISRMRSTAPPHSSVTK